MKVNTIPEELITSLIHWNNKRERAEKFIAAHTNSWVEAQEKIIEINDAIEKLGKTK